MSKPAQSADKAAETILTTQEMAALFGVTTQRLFQLRNEAVAVMEGRDAWSLPKTIRQIYALYLQEAWQVREANKTITRLRKVGGPALDDIKIDTATLERELLGFGSGRNAV
jgi:DNA-binding XRE family transcriptional regulator